MDQDFEFYRMTDQRKNTGRTPGRNPGAPQRNQTGSSRHISSGRQDMPGGRHISSERQDISGSRNISSGRRDMPGNHSPSGRSREDGRYAPGSRNYGTPPPRNGGGRFAGGGGGGKPPKKKRNKVLVTLTVLLSVLVVGLVVFVGYVNHMLNKVYTVPDKGETNPYVEEDSLVQDEKVVNILLVGVDRRSADEASRSDSMILISIDSKNKALKMTSFMRDIWVEMPGKWSAKLNAAHAFGEMPLLLNTLEYNFNVKVDKYVLVDFDMFMDIVDDLGGVNVEVTEQEARFINAHTEVNIDYGPEVHLEPEEALEYARMRYLDSDFMRTFRQRKIITSILGQARTASLTKLTKMGNTVVEHVETNLTKSEISSLAMGLVFKYKNYEVQEFRLPLDDAFSYATIDGQSVLDIDLEKNTAALQEFIYGAGEGEEESQQPTE